MTDGPASTVLPGVNHDATAHTMSVLQAERDFFARERADLERQLDAATTQRESVDAQIALLTQQLEAAARDQQALSSQPQDALAAAEARIRELQASVASLVEETKSDRVTHEAQLAAEHALRSAAETQAHVAAENLAELQGQLATQAKATAFEHKRLLALVARQKTEVKAAKEESAQLRHSLAEQTEQTVAMRAELETLLSQHQGELASLSAEREALAADLAAACQQRAAVEADVEVLRQSLSNRDATPPDPHNDPPVFVGTADASADAESVVSQCAERSETWRMLRLSGSYPLAALRSKLAAGWALQPHDEPSHPCDVLLYVAQSPAPTQWTDLRWYRFIDLLAQASDGRRLHADSFQHLQERLGQVADLPTVLRPHVVARARWRLVAPVTDDDDLARYLHKESGAGKTLLARALLVVLPGMPALQDSSADPLDSVTALMTTALKANQKSPRTLAGSSQSLVQPAARASLHLDLDLIEARRRETELAKSMLESLAEGDDATLPDNIPDQVSRLSDDLRALADYLATEERHVLEDVRRVADSLGLGLDSAVPRLNEWADAAAERYGVGLKDAVVEVDNGTNDVWVDQSLGSLLS